MILSSDLKPEQNTSTPPKLKVYSFCCGLGNCSQHGIVF